MSVSFGLPQSSAAAQALVDHAQPGTVFTLPNGFATFNVDLSRRPDLSFMGAYVGGVGNFDVPTYVGTFVKPETAGRPIFTVAPPALSQTGPRFYNLNGYMPDHLTDFLYVKNCNNGAVRDCGMIYGRHLVNADGGADNAWWDCVNLRGHQCAAVVRFNANTGWTVCGLVHFDALKGQTGVIFDGYAQLNTVTHLRVDGTLDLSQPTGYGMIFQGGAHHNTVALGKCEATNGALLLPSASGPPTTCNTVEDMVFSSRTKTTLQVDIRAGVELTKIGDGCSFPGGNTAPLKDAGTVSQTPMKLRISA